MEVWQWPVWDDYRETNVAILRRTAYLAASIWKPVKSHAQAAAEESDEENRENTENLRQETTGEDQGQEDARHIAKAAKRT